MSRKQPEMHVFVHLPQTELGWRVLLGRIAILNELVEAQEQGEMLNMRACIHQITRRDALKHTSVCWGVSWRNQKSRSQKWLRRDNRWRRKNQNGEITLSRTRSGTERSTHKHPKTGSVLTINTSTRRSFFIPSLAGTGDSAARSAAVFPISSLSPARISCGQAVNGGRGCLVPIFIA